MHESKIGPFQSIALNTPRRLLRVNDNELLSQLRIDPEQRHGGSGKRWVWYVAGVVVLAVLAAGGLLALKTQAVVVETATAQAPVAGDGKSPAILDAAGYVTARVEATVSSKITGKLEQVLIEEGDNVEEGQVLARLDNTDQQAQLNLARAQLSAVQAQVGQLRAQWQQARRNYKRQQELNSRKLTSSQAVEDAHTQMTTLASQLAAQRKQIDVAKAELNVAQINYDNTIIRAPFSGVVVAKAAQPGEIVSPMSAGGGYTRTGICTIVDMDSLEVEVDVNEAYINRVKPRQPVDVVLDAYPNWKIPAEVIAIIPTADRSKATVRVRIALKEKDARIVPDMGVRVSFYEDQPGQAEQTPKGVLVPASAIVQRGGQSVVFVINGDRVKRLPVTPGQSYGDLRLLDSGLQSGVRVVRGPPADLEDGMRIKLKTTD
jgi:RND family efflux transporter MFP subunit